MEINSKSDQTTNGGAIIYSDHKDKMQFKDRGEMRWDKYKTCIRNKKHFI